MKLADMMELGPALLDGLQEATEDASVTFFSRSKQTLPYSELTVQYNTEILVNLLIFYKYSRSLVPKLVAM